MHTQNLNTDTPLSNFTYKMRSLSYRYFIIFFIVIYTMLYIFIVFFIVIYTLLYIYVAGAGTTKGARRRAR